MANLVKILVTILQNVLLSAILSEGLRAEQAKSVYG